MSRIRQHGDAGQAFPIYLTVVGGLLFLALAYLAVGQAGANRNGAQTAADAAALAAAQDWRDQLAGQWVENVADPESWQDIFDGLGQGLTPSCWRAEQLAAQNGAALDACTPVGPLEYTVEVTAEDSVGESIVPGTENVHARAVATAVVEPRCTFEPPGPDADADDETLPGLTCDGGEEWEVDPDDPTGLPEPRDLFDVHLTDA
ncbi:pilus assembly protein TadG-related protein [Streptomyces sp. NPDC090994]|uniref:pilus assembly protein TadG-related protein n=1 Tax=Streptomyces sp. NPDC090994 TaxID=3365969 RepID=UPI003821B135